MRSVSLMLVFIFLLLVEQAICQHAIDTALVVEVGGIKQYVRIRGKDDTKPLLLFLHGGPGGSMMARSSVTTGNLQQQFVVIHWDQRETGETLKLNKSTVPLTLGLFVNDTHDLVDSLLGRYNRQKLYLAGYSWGTVLGFSMAEKYPQLLYAYIAISPVVDQWRSDSISLAMMKQQMGAKANKELEQVRIPFLRWEQLYYHRKWLGQYNGREGQQAALPRRFVETWASTWFEVWSEACGRNLFLHLPMLECPVYFIAGDKDYLTNHTVAVEYYKALDAPVKDFFLINNAGHELVETHASQYQSLIMDSIVLASQRSKQK